MGVRMYNYYMHKLLHVNQSQCLPFIGRTTLYLVNGLTINYGHMNNFAFRSAVFLPSTDYGWFHVNSAVDLLATVVHYILLPYPYDSMWAERAQPQWGTQNWDSVIIITMLGTCKSHWATEVIVMAMTFQYGQRRAEQRGVWRKLLEKSFAM